MVEKKRVVESSKAEKGHGTAMPTERQCAHRFADGRQCRRRRWAGKEVCYQHDKAAQAEKKLKQGSRQSPGFTVAQVQELLAITMGQVLFGKMPVGRAYALGYLAQQSLAATAASANEKKLDVKHFWEMVDMGATFERAAELAKERKKESAEARRKAREAKEAESFAPRGGAQDEEAEEEAETETAFTAEDAENTEETEVGTEPEITTEDTEGSKGEEETEQTGQRR